MTNPMRTLHTVKTSFNQSPRFDRSEMNICLVLPQVFPRVRIKMQFSASSVSLMGEQGQAILPSASLPHPSHMHWLPAQTIHTAAVQRELHSPLQHCYGAQWDALSQLGLCVGGEELIALLNAAILQKSQLFRLLGGGGQRESKPQPDVSHVTHSHLKLKTHSWLLIKTLSVLVCVWNEEIKQDGKSAFKLWVRSRRILRHNEAYWGILHCYDL